MEFLQWDTMQFIETAHTHNIHAAEVNPQSTKPMKSTEYLQLQKSKLSLRNTIINVIFTTDWLPGVK